MANPEEVLAYWLDELGPQGWYKGGDAIDQQIKDRFETSLEQARAGSLAMWLTYPTGTLAYLILTDQFSRNIYRGQAQAFASDRAAITAAKTAIAHGWDMKIDEPARQFFYMPLMHSENLCDQDRCVRLMSSRMPSMGASNLLHAQAHREIIRQFGRFPFRNAALGRAGTAQEARFMADGGYAHILESLKADVAA